MLYCNTEITILLLLLLEFFDANIFQENHITVVLYSDMTTLVFSEAGPGTKLTGLHYLLPFFTTDGSIGNRGQTTLSDRTKI